MKKNISFKSGGTSYVAQVENQDSKVIVTNLSPKSKGVSEFTLIKNSNTKNFIYSPNDGLSDSLRADIISSILLPASYNAVGISKSVPSKRMYLLL